MSACRAQSKQAIDSLGESAGVLGRRELVDQAVGAGMIADEQQRIVRHDAFVVELGIDLNAAHVDDRDAAIARPEGEMPSQEATLFDPESDTAVGLEKELPAGDHEQRKRQQVCLGQR